MTTLINVIQFGLLLFSVFVFFCGVFKPSFIVKRPFRGRRFLLIIFVPILLLICLGLLQDYKVETLFSPEERSEYYAELEESARQDSVRNTLKEREKFIQDSINQSNVNNKALSMPEAENECYSCVIDNVKYKDKKITGIGLGSLKRMQSRYVIVSFTLKNNLNHAIQLEQDSFRLYDGENFYNVSVDAQTEAEISSNLFASYSMFYVIEEINPQITRKFKMIFEVPKKGDYKLICSDKRVHIKYE